MTDIDTAASTDDVVLHFPEGIPGFPSARDFRLHEVVEDSAFQLLESVHEDAVSMVVAQPWLFFPDYAPEIGRTDQRELDLARPEDATLFCSVAIDAEAREFHLNLRAPFVVNARTRRARQVVLDQDLPLRAVVRMDAG